MCPGCQYDFGTGEGQRGCSWGECPYFPEELNVFCEDCRFDYFTMEGNHRCEDPLICEQGAAALVNLDNYRQWRSTVAAP